MNEMQFLSVTQKTLLAKRIFCANQNIQNALQLNYSQDANTGIFCVSCLDSTNSLEPAESTLRVIAFRAAPLLQDLHLRSR